MSSPYALPLRTIPQFFLQSTRVELNACTLFTHPNRLGRVRCSVIVPKKIEKHAVDRNRTKRKVKELVLKDISTLPLDVVIRIKKPNLTRHENSLHTTIVQIKSTLHSLD